MSDEERQRWQEYFDTRAAAEYLGMSPRTLEKLRSVGGGPAFYKLSGIRYLQGDLDAWRDSRRRVSTSDRGPVAVTR